MALFVNTVLVLDSIYRFCAKRDIKAAGVDPNAKILTTKEKVEKKVKDAEKNAEGYVRSKLQDNYLSFSAWAAANRLKLPYKNMGNGIYTDGDGKEYEFAPNSDPNQNTFKSY